MRKLKLFVVFAVILLSGFAQDGKLIFVGHNSFGDKPLLNCYITVVENGRQIQSINTGNSPDFKLMIPFGKNYSIYFQNARAQKMFLELKMDNIPVKVYGYAMTYEFTIPYFPKDSKNLDTTQFKYPFHRVIFDGKNRMTDDTAYMRKFIAKVYVEKKEEEVKEVKAVTAKWVNLAGKFVYSNNGKAPAIFKRVLLKDEKGNLIKTTATNKYGTFIFTGVDLSKAHRVELDFNKEFTDQKVSVELINMKDESQGIANVTANKAGWENTAQNKVIEKLIDTRFSYKISAKLILESGQSPVFYSGKTVYLLNDKNTTLKKVKTNVLGSFVFTDVKPGYTYLIGVDKTDVPAGSKLHLYTNQEKYLAPVDSSVTNHYVKRFSAEANLLFNELLIDDSQLKMNVQGKLYGDNLNNPIGDLKILLLNDKFESIDTTTTDNFGRFMFKYIPYSSDYSITSLNDKDQLLEAISNILVYNSEDELVKIVSNIKGRRFSYKPLSSEQNRLLEIYADDPWLPMMNGSVLRKDAVIVENILFESNKSDLLPDAQKTLEKIALVLNSNPNIKVELSAHTDSNGNDTYNQTLSEQRAKTATTYILARGVEAGRIVSKGYGETRIMNRCKNGVFCPDDEHQQNRRIEFKILKN
jgi:outer membrane protein OmpA-like peptidoglycan-associated protein